MGERTAAVAGEAGMSAADLEAGVRIVVRRARLRAVGLMGAARVQAVGIAADIGGILSIAVRPGARRVQTRFQPAMASRERDQTRARSTLRLETIPGKIRLLPQAVHLGT